MKTNLNIPDIITLGNLTAGFLGIIYLIEGQPIISIKLVVIAAILDGLDGLTARILYEEGSNQFGVQLDSLADATSFGVLPAAILYTTIDITISIPLAILFIATSVIRLARFNKNPTKKHFQGIPTTSAGLTLALYTIYFEAIIPTTIVVTTLSILMISNIKYPKITTKPRIIAGILLILVAATTGTIFTITSITLLSLVTAYILIGPIKTTIIKTTIAEQR
ncbi:CDP-diacylglycerol--serine O-phosphatidyltransferase [Methanonatronarchaeum sp. AMET-Sl]|uniref:CDP-diacylglycerol--serine O-phosphatidyltransferase n=1 Tax=Methanonatronarchaeum sp. AMET-Sl TaxID=3037654 RepID=UPI00244E26BE|nr:CDP-diacylglycerol--serine O-phosphatidyltransferase [Methanonatronarchaeum sp. AMET-Sl]WGI17484.1 CDP-diacylglycerol--serine O-phosphatidyltransferase [Methanonatronarchaeum sp. AMET-Sl]